MHVWQWLIWVGGTVLAACLIWLWLEYLFAPSLEPDDTRGWSERDRAAVSPPDLKS